MNTTHFAANTPDVHTFAPFVLHDCLNTEWKDLRLSFSNWAWLEAEYGCEPIDNYNLNGYGIEGLVKAALFAGHIDPYGEGIHYNSEGDACYIHFSHLATAVHAAALAAIMITDKAELQHMIRLAREQGFED
ncbi:hypothetical protein [Uliginosibacterium gangwonense]|uniref:hypothetical protein n=1 Tax=Uliginosibacterium gangwonense TaxID=392736 RepID=UPI0003635226|nr:hypothetical protein [Uliginosibacterium gangwonense]